MRSPYVFVGGRHQTEGSGAEFFICQDGKTWQPAKDNLDRLFSVVGPARYRYQLKCQLEAAARLQRSPSSTTCRWRPWRCRRWPWARTLLLIPTIPPGRGKSGSRTAGSSGPPRSRRLRRPPRSIRLTAGRANGTDIVFRWTTPEVPDGEPIGDYQFELSRRADLKLPLSMDFYKLISRTADAVPVATRDRTSTSARSRASTPCHCRAC